MTDGDGQGLHKASARGALPWRTLAMLFWTIDNGCPCVGESLSLIATLALLSARTTIVAEENAASPMRVVESRREACMTR